jgi:hypothetical protein
MKIKQLNKLFNCLSLGMAFIVTAMMFSASANAQIVYTDVNPDVTINTNGGVYALDLNNDGITDFNITFATAIFGGQTNKYIMITPLGANKVGTDYVYPSALPLNTLIDDSSFTWLSTAQPLISRIWFQNPQTGAWLWQHRGNWNGVSDKYVPLQLDLSSQKFYGWARLDAAIDTASFTVKDYAYNSILNQPILAGQTVATGIIENSFASSINLFPNPSNNHLTIALGSNNKNVVRKDSYGEITITDITGKIIYTTTLTDLDSYREKKLEVNTNEFAAGIYVVKAQAAGFIGSKKLIVEK